MNSATPPAKSTGWHWPLIIFGLLGSQMLIWFVMLFIALSDPTVAVEPDYYRKSLNWNDTIQQRADNQRLGWTIEFEIVEPTTVGENRTLRCQLINIDGAPLEGAQITIEAFARARANNRLHLSMSEAGKGWYETTGDLRRDGLWELRTTVDRGPETFTDIQEIMLPQTKAG